MEQLRMTGSVNRKLHYKTGTSHWKTACTINIKPGFKFLDANDTRYVLEDLWGNLKGQTAMGMILPAEAQLPLPIMLHCRIQRHGLCKDSDAMTLITMTC
jgi:hypothetical protein